MKTALPLIALTLGLAAGCSSEHYGSKDDPHRASIKVPSIDNTYEVVCAGRPPLSLIVTNGGWIKVLDTSTGELVHTSQIPAVNGGLVVKIDPNVRAITYSNTADKDAKPELILPISPDHTFEMYYQR